MKQENDGKNVYVVVMFASLYFRSQEIGLNKIFKECIKACLFSIVQKEFGVKYIWNI